MFELSLSKLALIGLVALVVVGPEKLPKIARMAGSLLGRAQRYFNDVKAEISRETALDELHKLRQNVQAAASDLHEQLSSLHAPPATAHAPDPAASFKAATFKRRRQSRLNAATRMSRHRAALSSSAASAARRSGTRPPSFFG